VEFVANLKIVEPLDMQKDSRFSPGPDAVLVSAPGHIIDLVPARGYREADYQGVGYLIIGKDFIANQPPYPPGGIGRMRIGRNFVVRPGPPPEGFAPDNKKES